MTSPRLNFPFGGASARVAYVCTDLNVNTSVRWVPPVDAVNVPARASASEMPRTVTTACNYYRASGQSTAFASRPLSGIIPEHRPGPRLFDPGLRIDRP